MFVCRLPECFCSVTGQEIPGDLPPDQVPQMIVITFDDAVNHNNYEEIERFLNSNLKNPNSCDIKTTFFVSHQYNNYSMVQVLKILECMYHPHWIEFFRNCTEEVTKLLPTPLVTRMTRSIGRTDLTRPGPRRWAA